FFSSRRRHTRFSRDWSSDVCSSDLYSNDKIKPGFPQTYLQTLLKETKTNLDTSIVEILFNDVDAKKVNLNQNVDLVQGSAVNFYGKGLTANDVEKFYGSMVPADSLRPLDRK